MFVPKLARRSRPLTQSAQHASRRITARALVLALCSAEIVAGCLRASFAAARPQLHDVQPLRLRTGTARVHRFHLPLAGLHVEVVDLAFRKPLAQALGNADLVVNGGFWGFHRAQRRIIGLLWNGTRQFAPFRRQLDGGVLIVADGRARIVPSRTRVNPRGSDLALQCRPRLVHDGVALAGLNAHARAPRTAACVRDRGRLLELYVTDPSGPSPTLHELGGFLAAAGCEQALNFDGGPSTAAAFHEGGRTVRVGAGVELPYALRFSYAGRAQARRARARR